MAVNPTAIRDEIALIRARRKPTQFTSGQVQNLEPGQSSEMQLTPFGEQWRRNQIAIRESEQAYAEQARRETEARAKALEESSAGAFDLFGGTTGSVPTGEPTTSTPNTPEITNSGKELVSISDEKDAKLQATMAKFKGRKVEQAEQPQPRQWWETAFGLPDTRTRPTLPTANAPYDPTGRLVNAMQSQPAQPEPSMWDKAKETITNVGQWLPPFGLIKGADLASRAFGVASPEAKKASESVNILQAAKQGKPVTQTDITQRPTGTAKLSKDWEDYGKYREEHPWEAGIGEALNPAWYLTAAGAAQWLGLSEKIIASVASAENVLYGGPVLEKVGQWAVRAVKKSPKNVSMLATNTAGDLVRQTSIDTATGEVTEIVYDSVGNVAKGYKLDKTGKILNEFDVAPKQVADLSALAEEEALAKSAALKGKPAPEPTGIRGFEAPKVEAPAPKVADTPLSSKPIVVKSKGHVSFISGKEYYIGPDGDLYSSDVGNYIEAGGPRAGYRAASRFESTGSGADRYLAELMSVGDQLPMGTPKPVVNSETGKGLTQKEPWMMTREEAIDDALAKSTEYQNDLKYKNHNTAIAKDMVTKQAIRKHDAAVTMAVVEGKPVPASVLKDYPDLAKIASKVEAPTMAPRTSAQEVATAETTAAPVRVGPAFPKDVQKKLTDKAKSSGFKIEIVEGASSDEQFVVLRAAGGDNTWEWLKKIPDANKEPAAGALKFVGRSSKGGEYPVIFKSLPDANKFLDTGDASLIAKSIESKGQPWSKAQLKEVGKAVAAQDKRLAKFRELTKELNGKRDELKTLRYSTKEYKKLDGEIRKQAESLVDMMLTPGYPPPVPKATRMGRGLSMEEATARLTELAKKVDPEQGEIIIRKLAQEGFISTSMLAKFGATALSTIPAILDQQNQEPGELSAWWWLPAAVGAISLVSGRRGVRLPRTVINPTGFAGTDRILSQAAAVVEHDRPGTVTALLNKIPGLKQVLQFERPGLKMSGANEKVLVGMTGEVATRADVATRLMATRAPAIKDLQTAFGKDVMHGGKSNIRFMGTDASPLEGTLLDMAQRPNLYDLNPQQKAALARLQAHTDAGLQLVNNNYGTKIGRFPPPEGGAFLSNIDLDKPVLDVLESEYRAAATGRGKTRIWDTAAARLANDSTFKPQTDVQKIIEGMDSFKASAASGETLRAALGGKTRLEVMQVTHPALYNKMTALRKRLTSLRGSLSRVDNKLHDAVDDFLNSSVEPDDINSLRDSFDVSLARGPRAGMGAEALEREINQVRAQLSALKPMWEAANPKPYTMVKEGIFRYFPIDTAKLIQESRQVTNNRLLNFIENWRGQAFSGDFSPFAIQDSLGVLADPVGSMKAAKGAIQKSADTGDWLRTVKASALAEDVAADPDGWAAYASMMGRSLHGTPAEFSAGFLSKIPGFKSFNEGTYVTVTRGSKAMFDRTWKDLVAQGLSEVDAQVVAANVASEVFPLINTAKLGQSQARAAVLRALPTSYSFIRQPAKMMTDAAKGFVKLGTFQKLSPTEKSSVRLMSTMAASVLAISATSAAISAQAKGKDVLQAMKDAVNPDPMNGKFASIIVGDYRIPLGGPYRSIFRAITPAKVPGVPIPVPFAGVPNYVMNRITPAVKTQLDLIKNKDYYGNQILKGDFPEQVLRGLAYEFEGSLPLTAGAVVEGLRTGQTPQQMAQEAASQFGGMNVIEATPAQRRNDVREQLARQEGKAWKELTWVKQQELTESNPMLKQLTDEARKKWRETDTPEAKLDREVGDRLDQAKVRHKEEITDAAKLSTRDNDWTTFKEAVSDWGRTLGSDYRIIYGKPEYQPVIAKWEELARQGEKQMDRDGLKEAIEDVAYQQYMAVTNDPALETVDAYGVKEFNYAELDKRKEEFGKTWGDYIVAYVKERRNYDERDYPKEYFELQDAKEKLKQYWSISDAAVAEMERRGYQGFQKALDQYRRIENQIPSSQVGATKKQYGIDLYEKMVKATRESWRKSHTEGDQLLAKYYGYKPMALQK